MINSLICNSLRVFYVHLTSLYVLWPFICAYIKTFGDTELFEFHHVRESTTKNDPNL